MECVGQELNLQRPKAGGLQPLGHANAQPTLFAARSPNTLRTDAARAMDVIRVARVGVEPTESQRFELCRFANCVPRRFSVLDGIRTHDLHRDRVASTPLLHEDVFRIAQVGLEPTASLVLGQGGLPIAYRAAFPAMPKAGVEPAIARV